MNIYEIYMVQNFERNSQFDNFKKQWHHCESAGRKTVPSKETQERVHRVHLANMLYAEARHAPPGIFRRSVNKTNVLMRRKMSTACET